MDFVAEIYQSIHSTIVHHVLQDRDYNKISPVKQGAILSKTFWSKQFWTYLCWTLQARTDRGRHVSMR